MRTPGRRLLRRKASSNFYGWGLQDDRRDDGAGPVIEGELAKNGAERA